MLTTFDAPAVIDLKAMVENHVLPDLWGSCRNTAITFGTEKLQCCGYPMVKKIKILLAEYTKVTTRRHRPRLCIALRGNNYNACKPQLLAYHTTYSPTCTLQMTNQLFLLSANLVKDGITWFLFWNGPLLNIRLSPTIDTFKQCLTSSPATEVGSIARPVAERPRDALYLSVVSYLERTVPLAYLFNTLASYLPLCTIKCCPRRNVEASCHKYFVVVSVVSLHQQTPPLASSDWYVSQLAMVRRHRVDNIWRSQG